MIFPGELRPELYNELGKEVIFYEAVLDEAVVIARDLEKLDIGVIISRGGTAEAIRRAVNIPVVNCEVTNSDLLNTLFDIKKEMGKSLDKVALVCYGNTAFDVVQFEKVLGVKVKQFWYWNNKNELYQRLCEIKEEGIDVVLGASMTVRFAKQLGMKGCLMQVGSETLRQAVEKAKEILEIRHNDLAQSEKIKSILSFAHEGIVSIDNDGIIDYANKRAEEIFRWKNTVMLGKKISEIIPNWINNNDDVLLDQIASIENQHIIYNQVPVIVKDRKIGTVFTLTEAEAVIQVEEKIRNLQYNRGLLAKYELKDIIGQSSVIKETLERAKLFGITDSTVLINGETGTGKELFAHGIHMVSARRKKPFVAINSAALPENLLESELFGYEEGAFSGARKGGKIGLFELAHKGTLFLDEIGEFPISLQARLLRVLQEKEVMRLGGNKIIPVDVRVIVATNRNLREAVKCKEFREDLFFRLNILELRIPPLRERLDDIPLLIDYFMNIYNKNSRKNDSKISSTLLERMCNYDWPGNVRQLESFIERYSILTNMDNKVEYDLFFEVSEKPVITTNDSKADAVSVNIESLSKILDDIYLEVYKTTGNNKTRTAKILGVNRMTVAKRLSKFKIT